MASGAAMLSCVTGAPGPAKSLEHVALGRYGERVAVWSPAGVTCG